MSEWIQRSIWDVFRYEWKYWLSGAILSFFIASLVFSGWPAGFIPNLDYPYLFSGDGLSYGWLLERVREGWFFDNPRSGYPFGSNFLDYPGSDNGNYLVIKIISLFTSSYAATFNLFVLLSFSVTFAVTYCVNRAIALNIPFSCVVALLFTIAPYHFQRVDHLFYLWYFVVPLFYYVAFATLPLGWSKKLLWGLGLVFLCSFGVYYALFGLIVLITASLSRIVWEGNPVNYRVPLFFATAMLAGVLINLSPSLIYKYEHGPNPENVAKRNPPESEYYSLRFIQLLLPMQEHRIHAFRTMANIYASTFQFVNENRRSNLGLVGAVGFISMLGVVFVALSGRQVDKKLRLISLVTLVLFMFGTMGGLGVIFAFFVSPEIRCWNRISIFISFGSLLGLFMIFQHICEKRFQKTSYFMACITIATLCSVVGLYDQTPPYSKSRDAQTKKAFYDSKDFVHAIEASLPPGSAIYQLPYMSFPEVPRKYDLDGYHFFESFINSTSLRWTYGGMKGREGDLFYRTLSEKSMKEQLMVIRKLGFAGIYIEKRGYADHGKSVINELTKLLGSPPALTRADGEVVYFRI